uniref:Uncharacterized protein n=1 Tax=Compsopogon caeruleus TaxID=31354 RepID=A0A7S1T9J7_9RHOD|mmetsp:Transcript_1327/g.2775  ORF Transcript_1327/g.2775 Transcript_1327/m.2775 type:complete len:673 (+) Transcript_1327:125-2143(+)
MDRIVADRDRPREESRGSAFSSALLQSGVLVVAVWTIMASRGLDDLKAPVGSVQGSTRGDEGDPASSPVNTPVVGERLKSVIRGSGLGSFLDSIEPTIVTTSSGKVVDQKTFLANAWSDQQPFVLELYTSESVRNLARKDALAGHHQAQRIWRETNLKLHFTADSMAHYRIKDADAQTRAFSGRIQLPESVSSGNGTLYIHAYLVNPDVEDEDVPEHLLLEAHDSLVMWRYEKVEKQARSLLSSHVNETTGDESEHSASERRYVQLWKPSIYLYLLPDLNNIRLQDIPKQLHPFYRVTEDLKRYLPPVYFSDFWLLREKMVEINDTVLQAPLTVTFRPTSKTRMSAMIVIQQSFDSQTSVGLQSAEEVEDLKRTLIDNPTLMIVTAIVSLLHTIFEMLAFASDIKHWRNIKSMEGISVRSMFLKIGMEVVIFLYLIDNETSFMVLLGSGFGILIEVWKLRKAVRPKNFGKKKLLGFIPFFELEETESYAKSVTKEYDEVAMRYLSYVLYPLVAAYSLYSLLTGTHKSWYSWIISSLVGAVYAFGFIMMFPQIFINYKLKSVAHLPMKAFMFKALNTVIDDLFSFIIKMPLMHRLACFRDDIVFVIFLYQRWIYPVDKTRVNEFGQSFVIPSSEDTTTIGTPSAVRQAEGDEVTSSTTVSSVPPKDATSKKDD